MHEALKLCLFSAHESHLIPRTPGLQLQMPNSLQLSLRDPCGLQLHARRKNKVKDQNNMGESRQSGEGLGKSMAHFTWQRRAGR